MNCTGWKWNSRANPKRSVWGSAEQACECAELGEQFKEEINHHLGGRSEQETFILAQPRLVGVLF